VRERRRVKILDFNRQIKEVIISITRKTRRKVQNRYDSITLVNTYETDYTLQYNFINKSGNKARNEF